MKGADLLNSRRDLTVGGDASIRDIDRNHGGRNPRRLDRLDRLDPRQGALNKIRGVELHAIAGSVLDPLPELLELFAQLNFLAELQLTSLSGVDDPVLEKLAGEMLS